MSFSNIWSHPPNNYDQNKEYSCTNPTDFTKPTLLITHSSRVAQSAKKLVPQEEISFSDKENSVYLPDLMEDIALLHDIGKTIPEFQQYIRGEFNGNSQLKNHPQIGALIGSYVCLKKYKSHEIKSIVYTIIYAHHRALDQPVGTQTKFFGSTDNKNTIKRKNREKQIDSLYSNTQCLNVAEELISRTGSSIQLGDREKETLRALLNGKSCYENCEGKYEVVLSLWSALILADKVDASGLNEDVLDYNTISSQPIDTHIEELNKTDIDVVDNSKESNISQLNKLREQARQNVKNNAKKLLQQDNSVGKITLPTGFGKTYTGLTAGLELATNKSEQSTVIYALPYTSIVDQTDDEIQDIFDFDHTDQEYTIHHHLAETITKIDSSEYSNKNTRDEYQLAKSWRSGLVLTTFVQLFESLVTPKNQQGLKIPSLKDSVIILDEPQALSKDWWNLIPYLCRQLMEKYNVTILTMTATHPNIFEDSEYTPHVEELTKHTEQYQEYLKDNPRVKYELHDSAEQFVREGVTADPIPINNAAREMPQSKDTLAICNTRQTAKKMYRQSMSHMNGTSINGYLNKTGEDHLYPPAKSPCQNCSDDSNISPNFCEGHDGESKCIEHISRTLNECNSDTFLAHLSTDHRPKDRKRIIQIMKSREKWLDDSQNLVVISTQLVEAGVDVSFERVYRDLAPLSSVVQAAGRCNRSGDSQSPESVIVWRLIGDDDLPPSQQVYANDINLIQPTRKALQKLYNSHGKIIPEFKMISSGVNHYFSILQNKDAIGSEQMVEELKKYNLSELSDLRMIESPNSVEVIVPVDPDEKSKTENITNGKIPDAQKWELIEELQSIQVSVPVYDEDDLINVGSNLVQINGLDEYYIANAENLNVTGLDISKQEAKDRLL